MAFCGLFLLAVLPGLLLTIYFQRKDHIQPEPWHVVRNSFFVGMLLMVPTGYLELWLLGDEEINHWLPHLLRTLFFVGLVEELAKWLGIRIYPYRNFYFDEVMDGIVYGAAVSAGFATIENILFVMNYGFATGLVRAVISVPVHIFSGAIIGFWLAKRQFHVVTRVKALIYGLGSATLCHGLFDFFLSLDGGRYFYLIALPAGLLIVQLLFHVREGLQLSMAEFGPSKTLPFWANWNPHLRELIQSVFIACAIVCTMFTFLFLYGTFSIYVERNHLSLFDVVVPAIPALGACFFGNGYFRLTRELPVFMSE